MIFRKKKLLFVVFTRNKKGRENEVGEMGQPMFLKISPHTMAIGLWGV